MVVARGWGERGMGSCCLMDTECQFCKMKKFQRRIVVMVTQQCEYTQHYWTVHLKMVKMAIFMVCAFYHNLFKKSVPLRSGLGLLEGSRRWVKNYVFGFNLSFGFFSQCSLHIHASYSISQKLNVPMAPLSEPNAVGIVIAHGKQPCPPLLGKK